MKDLPPTLLCHPFSTPVQISGEGSALSFLPYSKLNFHISFFFFFLPKDMTHLHFPVLADQNLLIESKRKSTHPGDIEFVSSPCLNTLHTLGSLITCSRSHAFVSTNVEVPLFFSLAYCNYTFFSCQSTDAQKICPKLSFNLWFTIFARGAFLRLALARGCLGFTPLLLHLSCRRWILIEA